MIDFLVERRKSDAKLCRDVMLDIQLAQCWVAGLQHRSQTLRESIQSRQSTYITKGRPRTVQRPSRGLHLFRP